MENFIIAGLLLLILGCAARYVYKEKKRGVKCIGCPAAGKCSGKCGGGAESDCNRTCGNKGE